MTEIRCDICGGKIVTYTDQNGKVWDNFTVRERRKMRPKLQVHSWYEAWWRELDVCGKCRKALAECADFGKQEG